MTRQYGFAIIAMSSIRTWQFYDSGECMIEQFLYLSALFDMYGSLLTEKQQECLRLHLFEDFSLSEIGEALGISRQAVYDNIHRSEKAMESYEAKLGLAARYREERRALTGIYEKIEELREPGNESRVDAILQQLRPFLGTRQEV